jgi:hypothetical protein
MAKPADWSQVAGTYSTKLKACLQAALLLAALAWGLGAWGAPEGSALHDPAADYLRWRAAGAPAYALLLACQVPNPMPSPRQQSCQLETSTPNL